MEDHRSQEEIQLDRYMESVERQEIPVPQELDLKVYSKIQSLKPKGTYGRRFLAACVTILILFVGAVRWSPEFAAYAATIPGFKTAVEWIQGDAGIRHAKQKGYPEISPIVVEEKGYYLKLDNIFLDEDRISLSAVVGGNEIMTNHLDRPSQIEKEIQVGSEESLAPDFDAIGFDLIFTDFEDGSLISASGKDHDTYLFRSVEKTFQSDEIEKFLSTNPNVLHVNARIYRGREVLYEFDDIQIPIDITSFQLSQKYVQNQSISFAYGRITVEKLTVSPTRMRVDMGFDMVGDYFFTGFENLHLKDNKGNIYRAEGLVSSNWSEDRRSMYFVPSLYFDKLPKELFLCFDGVRIGTTEGQEFTLYLDGSYPKTITYMGEDIVIQQLLLTESGKLQLKAALPSEDRLRIQSFHIKDYAGAKSWSEYEGVLQSFFDVSHQDAYIFQLEYPGYYVPLETTVPLHLQ